MKSYFWPIAALMIVVLKISFLPDTALVIGLSCFGIIVCGVMAHLVIEKYPAEEINSKDNE